MEEDLFYRALGDSLTVGIGSYFNRGFVSRYAQMAVEQLNRPVRTEVFAKNRMTSGQLRTMIHDQHVRSRLMHSNIVTITVGGNDLIQANRMFLRTYNPIVFEHAEQQLYENLLYILYEIQILKWLYPTSYFIRLIGLYNPYPQLGYSQFWINRFNDVLRSLQTDHIRYVDILPHFSDGGRNLLAFGSVHPNRNGYNLIAKQLVNSGFSPLKI
ncbi:GDSL-type esterase/lipase family protein [Alkalibacillus haloalkaliphilus]|uniref:GDSL-type esterase/lipase family protein n=1 Tax=Alkalibacillus haloalkaliphilus TaxID=94136 RepID=UPI0002EB955B|nr:GDSL-type esterase/lipase family protein [Alkalibacillus haloalkaliphilus]